MWYFTGDEHYGHMNIIRHCQRPFKDTTEMDLMLIENFNQTVRAGDVTVHAGDFTWESNRKIAARIIECLNGDHIFIKGDHDNWLSGSCRQIWEKNIEGVYIVVCHYPMRTWPKSHYGSVMLHAHCHGRLAPLPNQWDIGVDNNDFKPVSFDWIVDNVLKKEVF